MNAFPGQTFHLGNWRDPPFNRRSFNRVREIIPTAAIAASVATPFARNFTDIGGMAIPVPGGGTTTFAHFLEESFTDAWMVLHRGKVVHEWYRNAEAAFEPHIVFSVSKSITAILAGILWADGRLDPDAPVASYVPEAKSSTYGDASVRHVLDMTISVAFTEDYLNPDETFLRYRESTGWNPRRPGAETLHGFLTGLGKGNHPQGERFNYRSPNSDLLGWIVERAGGERFSEMMSQRLWQPMGAARDAYVTVDPEGAPRTAGGICTTIEDLARFGEMLRCRGVANGRQVVPGTWIDDIRTGGSVDDWKRGDMVTFLAECRYRSKWYNRVGDSEAFMAIGIHGQWLYIDPRADLVVAKQSSQEQPVSDGTDHLHLAAFDTLARELN